MTARLRTRDVSCVPERGYKRKTRRGRLRARWRNRTLTSTAERRAAAKWMGRVARSSALRRGTAGTVWRYFARRKRRARQAATPPKEIFDDGFHVGVVRLFVRPTLRFHLHDHADATLIVGALRKGRARNGTGRPPASMRGPNACSHSQRRPGFASAPRPVKQPRIDPLRSSPP